VNKTNASIILERSSSLCEYCGAPAVQFAHLLHRKMGGRHGKMKAAIDDPRNVAHLCLKCHDSIDGRQYNQLTFQVEVLRLKIGWYEWAKEIKNEP